MTSAQRTWASARLGAAELVEDMSWGLVESTVLHLRNAEGDVVLKAGGPSNHHIAREISAHPEYTAGLVESGHAARLRDADATARVMLLDHLPGALVEGTDAEHDRSTHTQAGALLRRLHEAASRIDTEIEAATTARALRWLDGPHRVARDAEHTARRILEGAPTPAVRVVPTHGDWQPRNWLIHDGVVRVIDFGRFAFRPPSSDLTRLAVQQWRDRPELERAFLDGYGEDPRDVDGWRRDQLKTAIGTACWAFQVGDEEFEAQGHRMLSEALAEF